MTGAERATMGGTAPCGHYNPSLVGDWCANCAWTKPTHTQDLVELATTDR